MASLSKSGTLLSLKILLTMFTNTGTISSGQRVKCSLIKPKESVALLFFNFVKAFLISSSVTRSMGPEERKQISSIWMTSVFTLFKYRSSNQGLSFGVARSWKWSRHPVHISSGDSYFVPSTTSDLV